MLRFKFMLLAKVVKFSKLWKVSTTLHLYVALQFNALGIMFISVLQVNKLDVFFPY